MSGGGRSCGGGRGRGSPGGTERPCLKQDWGSARVRGLALLQVTGGHGTRVFSRPKETESTRPSLVSIHFSLFSFCGLIMIAFQSSSAIWWLAAGDGHRGTTQCRLTHARHRGCGDYNIIIGRDFCRIRHFRYYILNLELS